MEPRYAIGLDYGTNSVRAVVVDLADGTEIASSVYEYPSGEQGILLDATDPHLARQNPADYVEGYVQSVGTAVRTAMKHRDFKPDKVVGIGVDTTGSHCRRTAPDVFAAAQAWVELADFVPAFLAGQTDPSTLLSPWHDKRARGLGGRPVSCGEENLLDFQGPPCHTENIFIHEFGHALHGALAGLDEPFNTHHVPLEDTHETHVCSIDHHCRDLADSVSRRRR